MQHGQNLTSGPIGKQLWSLAWPMMLSIFFHTFYNLVDAFWVAKISPAAIAAVSISQLALFVMISLAMGISVGSAVLMGMSVGAGDRTEASRILGQGYLLSLIAAVIFTALAILFREPFLQLSGAIGEIYPLALSYFTITSLGSVVMFLMMNTSTAFNAQGDNFTATKLFAISTLVNVLLDPLFIFGYGPVPAFGVAGAAYATIISQVVFLLLAARILMGESMMVRLDVQQIKLQWDSVKKVFNIGLPASLTQTINPLGFLALMALIAAHFGEAGAAAFSIGFRIEFFAFIPAIGFGFAAMAMMGQNLGAKQFDRLMEVIKTAIKFGAGAALVFSVMVFVAAKLIVLVFTDDVQVIEYASSYFRIVPLGYAFFAVAFIEASLFQGVGRSWPGFWITVGRAGLMLGVAYGALTYAHSSINFVWMAIVLGSVVSSVFGFWWIWSVIQKLLTPAR